MNERCPNKQNMNHGENFIAGRGTVCTVAVTLEDIIQTVMSSVQVVQTIKYRFEDSGKGPTILPRTKTPQDGERLIPVTESSSER